MVEIDVLALADGTLVLVHSNDLREVSHGAADGRVTTQSLASARSLPRRIGRLLARADAAVATLNYLVVSAEVVRRCHARGAAVYAWTIDDRDVVRRLAALGVDESSRTTPGSSKPVRERTALGWSRRRLAGNRRA